MTPSPVGMRCPDCATQSGKAVRLPAMSASPDTPVVTLTLIGLCVLGYLLSGGFPFGNGQSQLFYDGALAAAPVGAGGQYWRLVTSGFLHAGLMHLAFNMILLWFIGSQMEPQLGRGRFLALYVVSLLGGSFGALLLSPDALTVGASGAIFGLMGAASAIIYARGGNPLQSGIGMLLVFNIVFSFVLSNVSIGGHLGGLAAGALAGGAFVMAENRGKPAIGWAACAAIGVVAVVGSLVLAAASTPTFGG
jgi:membrane associated rhomboid family serine protease